MQEVKKNRISLLFSLEEASTIGRSDQFIQEMSY